MVVTDDGSSDATTQIVRAIAARDPRVDFAVQRHAGMTAARNACLARARGSYIALLDQDDLCPSGKLTRQLALLERSPETAAVFGVTQFFDDAPREEPGYTMLLAAGLFRRETLDAVGHFDQRFESADDFDFLLRLIESGLRIELEPGLGACHRRHARQATADKEATKRECLRALSASLQRRRRAGIRGPLRHPLIADGRVAAQ